MNTKSVRFRLTALYSSALIFSLAILFVSFYWVTKRELYSHTDLTLQSHASRIVTILNQGKLPVDTQMSSQLLSDVFNETPGMLVFITNNQGDILSVSQNVTDSSKIANILASQLKPGTSTLFVNQEVGSMLMRFRLVRLTTINGSDDIIIVGHPIDVIQKSLQSLYGNLTLVFLSFVIPTIFGGFMLAGSALKPVAEMSEEMQKISSENLKLRVKSPQTHDEIENLAQSFNGLLNRLEEAFTRERQFIGDVAHELKTPLSTLKGGIDVALSRERSQTEYKKVLQELLTDANRLSGTLTNILDLAWSRADVSKNMKETVNVTELLKELTEIAQKLAYGKKIKITTSVIQNITVKGKRDKLFRAILNIVDNAIKYTGPGGHVSIVLRKTKDSAVIHIKDSGRGIAVHEVPHVFDRFYRGSSGDKTVGSGLGLSIAKAVITSCGGSIDLTSKIGKGTTVTIEFPLANQEA